MRKKIISMLMVFVMGFVCVSCNVDPGKNVANDSSSPSEGGAGRQLQILKSDMKLTQEQMESRIKADYLIKNNGYRDDDEIVAILTLPDDSLIETYLGEERASGKTVAEYARSNAGAAQESKIENKQKALIRELENKNLIDGVEYTYSTIINAVSVKTTYGDFKKIGKLASVESTILSDTFNLPQSAGTDASAIENVVDVYETGIFNSSSVSYTGKGTAVAILDSGFDCSHSVFQNQPATSDLWLTQQGVSSVLPETNASKTTKDLELTDVWYSKKVPFVYDYADKDQDVFPYDSEHGTHVAGIIGGKDDVITGVAVDTQLVLMKVFPDLNDGADTDDILAALEDAVRLNVDAINMSLGSSCGFAREEDGNAINDVYDRINESGISLVTAASNAYSSGYGGEQGNTNFVTNPDSGTVGSPSTYAAALSVASISGTKSKYMVGNDSQVIFFTESNSVTGEPNDFFKELGLQNGETKTYEYVTIPGSGLKVNYASVGDLTGKIALVRRGDNTFEDKALQAKNAGAAGCIIYNNVDGDILMSMGKTDHIPTISVSKDQGTILASREKGTLAISYEYQAGPFMSDFSSWGPLPNLELKPEITAHGGNIKSSVPGGGYDELSGTSMASPNLCGIVVLIRQYLKEKFPAYTAKQISVLANQLLMSTATIIRNEEGNPYSPRKQGAGLASLFNVVNTKAYLTVDGIDRSKLELKDDPKRTGEYTMNFNIVNLSNAPVKYNLSMVGMTESVSTSDSKHVAETGRILDGKYKVKIGADGSLNGDVVTVNANKTLKVTVTYTLSDADKNLIDSLFPYGMYVEGFVKLQAIDEGDIDLSVPFLAFYGDWTQAPMFDKTYYEVESEAHDASIDDEDKIKADYFATTPYGSYFYNYIIPLGTYLYDIDTDKYDEIPASEDHIALSNTLGTIDGISSVYAGLLRNAKAMNYTIVDKLTGEVMYDFVDHNAHKAHSEGGTPVPYYEFLNQKSTKLKLVNNRQYEFKMTAVMDYGDGGAASNMRNSFAFDFYLDDEAPVLKEVSYEKVYDKTLKKDRYYLTMTIYDNQYVQSITPISFTSSSSYTFLTENPIPVYSERGQDNVVRFEITDYLDELYTDSIINSALAFSIDDYALNSNIYLCQLPGTKGEFKFTKDGTMDGTDLTILSIYEDEVVDLTEYLATADATADADKDYLKYLVWSSSNERIASVEDGQVRGLKAGRSTITVSEQMDLRQASLIINVKARPAQAAAAHTLASGGGRIAPMAAGGNADVNDATIESIRFSYFNTLFAYSRAAQKSQIGSTGDRIFISALPGGVSFYPGEKIRLFYDLKPWYVEDKYEFTYASTNEKVAVVDQDGVVTALKKGTTTIVLSVKGSNLKASLRITVNSEFIIENRMLVAYKGLGGKVVIPDDEGILYIGPYAFCLYDTDNTIELPEDDFDANKIPSMNTSVTSVVVPDGVEDIQKYAFYNCSGLQSVVLPDTVRFIRDRAFYNNAKLTTINLEDVEVIGGEAFKGCSGLDNIYLTKAYTVGVSAFENCAALAYVDLTALRNTGREAFKNCASLASVKLTENTKLSYGMFAQSGLTEADVYERVEIPAYCFANCDNLIKVTLHNDLVSIGKGAFCQNDSLSAVDMRGKVGTIGEQAFYDCGALKSIALPDGEVALENYAFYKCTSLESVTFKANTEIAGIGGSIFWETNLSRFVVDAGNARYSVSADGCLLLSKDGKTIVFAATGKDYGDYVLDEKYTTIGDSAFAGAKITSLTIVNKDTVIADYAFANCTALEKIVFPAQAGTVIGLRAFSNAANLRTAENLDKVQYAGDYAFASSGLREAAIGDNAEYGEGAFFQSKLEKATIGAGATFGLGAFQNCLSLKIVVMPEGGNVHFGEGCFANDASLETIDLSKLDGTIEAETFYGCKSLKTANLVTVEEIGNHAFSDCGSLMTIHLPKVTKIGDGAFARNAENGGAPIVTEIILPDTLVSLGDGVFIGCEGLQSIVIPGSVQKIGDYLFAYCLNLKKAVIPASITRIGQYSFAGCSSLTEINLGHVTEIADYAFTSDESLKTVDLSSVKTIGYGSFAATALAGSYTANDLVSVGDYAFQNASLASFAAASLKTIGTGAFQNNAALKEFVFSKDVSAIGSLAFNGCTALQSFYYADGAKKSADGTINDYALLADGVLYTSLPSGRTQLASVPGGKKIDTLEVLEGTYNIDLYAGNANPNVTKVVLPDSLKRIGNYAFYGYKNLKTVEFKSVVAPALESTYNKDAELTESDPGYAILHDQFDLFGLELCYFTFIDLLGKKEPIQMILPANADVRGYDSVVFRVYFGKVEDAERSGYVAKEVALSNFLEYAKEISALKTVTLSDEKLINSAVSAYNAVKQNPTDYGYGEEEWNALVKTVLDAKAAVTALKLAGAGQTVKKLQAEIDALPDTYDETVAERFEAVKAAINGLSREEKALLDLTQYNKLLDSYNNFHKDPPQPTPPDPNPQPKNNALKIVLIVAGSVAAAAAIGAAVVIILKKRARRSK